MTSRRDTAGDLLWPVLLLGLAGDILFRADGLGLNVAIWTLGAVWAWWQHRRKVGEIPEGVERALLLAVLALGAAFVWRENRMLRFLDAVALLVSFALLPIAATSAEVSAVTRLTVGRIALALGQLLRRLIAGLVPTLLDANRAHRERRSGLSSTVAAVARGTVLAVPALLLFGGLLGNADPVFGDFLEGLVRFDVDRVVSHTMGLLGAGWLAAALLSGVLVEEWSQTAPPSGGLRQGLGRVEIGMILGLLNLLFIAFIAFQLPYLFGGAAWVERTAGVTLAMYARDGFFELVTVSALVLPLLLLLHACLHPDDRRIASLYRMLAGWQVLLVLVIMASAIHRMTLYQREFGLTEDRFFASAFIGGLAVTCCWFGATILRGSAARFAGGAVVAWAGWLALLHVLNPERIIVETNVARAESGQVLDVGYLGRLSADAVPALVAALPRIPASDRGRLVLDLEGDEGPLKHDWRDWHYGRARAERLIASMK